MDVPLEIRTATAVLDATPVDLTTTFVVSVEGKSVDPNFHHQVPYLAWGVLEQFLLMTGWSNYAMHNINVQAGYEDVSVLVPDKSTAVKLTNRLNELLPQASEGWDHGHNAFAYEAELLPDGGLGERRSDWCHTSEVEETNGTIGTNTQKVRLW